MGGKRLGAEMPRYRSARRRVRSWKSSFMEFVPVYRNFSPEMKPLFELLQCLALGLLVDARFVMVLGFIVILQFGHVVLQLA